MPFACLSCRRTFKRPFEAGTHTRRCPHCDEQAVLMDVRFRPPKKSDDRQWAKVAFLVEHGFYFQKVYRKEGPVWTRIRYPQTLEQARDFVIQYSDQAIQRTE